MPCQPEEQHLASAVSTAAAMISGTVSETVSRSLEGILCKMIHMESRLSRQIDAALTASGARDQRHRFPGDSGRGTDGSHRRLFDHDSRSEQAGPRAFPPWLEKLLKSASIPSLQDIEDFHAESIREERRSARSRAKRAQRGQGRAEDAAAQPRAAGDQAPQGVDDVSAHTRSRPGFAGVLCGDSATTSPAPSFCPGWSSEPRSPGPASNLRPPRPKPRGVRTFSGGLAAVEVKTKAEAAATYNSQDSNMSNERPSLDVPCAVEEQPPQEGVEQKADGVAHPVYTSGGESLGPFSEASVESSVAGTALFNGVRQPLRAPALSSPRRETQASAQGAAADFLLEAQGEAEDSDSEDFSILHSASQCEWPPVQSVDPGRELLIEELYERAVFRLKSWGVLAWDDEELDSMAEEPARGHGCLARLVLKLPGQVPRCIGAFAVYSSVSAMADAVNAKELRALIFLRLLDIVIALGALTGSFVMPRLLKHELFRSTRYLVTGYVRQMKLAEAWRLGYIRRVFLAVGLWFVASLLRFAAEWDMAYDGAPFFVFFVRVAPFSFCMFILASLSYCVDHLGWEMVMLVDAFSLHCLHSRKELEGLAEDWSVLQAVLRHGTSACGASIALLFAVSSSGLVTVVLAPIQDGDAKLSCLWTLGIVTPFVLTACSVLAQAASITEKCRRVPAVVNSMGFQFSMEERFLFASHIQRSHAGFFVKEVLINGTVVLKMGHLCFVAFFAVVSSIFTEQSPR